MSLAADPTGNRKRSAVAPPISCRLCGSRTEYTFGLTLMGKHDVSFYRCSNCESLQSEVPYWLDEAYENSNLAQIDTGAAQRNLTNLAAVYIWTWLSGTRTVFDFGGGDGLLCRLLRDYEIDARVSDIYAIAGYSQGFCCEAVSEPLLYTAFEVLEHFGNPAEDLKSIFSNEPRSVLVSTAIYAGQGREWWYLVPDSGQHVFFYSQKAMRLIGERFGYAVRFYGNYTLFDRHSRNWLTRALARLTLSRFGLRISRAAIMLFPARGPAADFAKLTDRSRD